MKKESFISMIPIILPRRSITDDLVVQTLAALTALRNYGLAQLLPADIHKRGWRRLSVHGMPFIPDGGGFPEE